MSSEQTPGITRNIVIKTEISDNKSSDGPAQNLVPGEAITIPAPENDLRELTDQQARLLKIGIKKTIEELRVEKAEEEKSQKAYEEYNKEYGYGMGY